MEISEIVDNMVDYTYKKLSACADVELDNDEMDQIREVLQEILEAKVGL